MKFINFIRSFSLLALIVAISITPLINSQKVFADSVITVDQPCIFKSSYSDVNINRKHWNNDGKSVDSGANEVSPVNSLGKGIDTQKCIGNKAIAAISGTVTINENFNNGQYKGYGYSIDIVDNFGTTVRYGYLKADSALIAEGSRVNVGTQIATIGSTGNSTFEHIHFEVRKNNTSLPYSQWKFSKTNNTSKFAYEKRTYADFDGDGLTDFVVTNSSGSYWYTKIGVSAGPVQIYHDESDNFKLGNVQFTTGDYDGDGKTDVIVTNKDGSFWYAKIGYSTLTQIYHNAGFTLGNVQFTPGDYDGDGKTDVIVTNQGGPFWYTNISYSTLSQIYHNAGFTPGNVQFTPGDYDGDRKTDVIVTNKDGSFWYTNISYSTLKQIYYNLVFTLGNIQFIPGNFDSDLRTDVLFTNSNGTYVYTKIGVSTGLVQIYHNETELFKLGRVQFTSGDFNGDGKTDVIVTNKDGSFWYTNIGDTTLTQIYHNPSFTLGNVQLVAGFFDTDFKEDVLFTNVGGTYCYANIGYSGLRQIYYNESDSFKLGKVQITAYR